MKILDKIQNLPEKIRKIILWSIIIALGLVLLFWWINNFQKRLTSFQGEQLIEELNLPEIEVPKIPEQDLEKLKEILKETETNGQ